MENRDHPLVDNFGKQQVTKTCLECFQISKMKCFTEVANTWKPLTIFAKCSMLDVWQSSEYTSG